ncbi:MAG: SRPBCC domain-containing protein [Anaerolineales bacterium]
MTIQSEESIQWKLHLKSSPERVFERLSTDEGRAKFWAESAEEHDGFVHFVFPGQVEWKGRILAKEYPHRFSVEYYGHSTATFELRSDGSHGTELTLTDQGVPLQDRTQVIAGWVSVLMALKASIDFGFDLRNHDPQRTWHQGYVEN